MHVGAVQCLLDDVKMVVPVTDGSYLFLSISRGALVCI